jgi:hypothetical protein
MRERRGVTKHKVLAHGGTGSCPRGCLEKGPEAVVRVGVATAAVCGGLLEPTPEGLVCQR